MTMLDDDFNGSKFQGKPTPIPAKQLPDREKFETFLFKLWDKAQVLQFDDFKGWANGEGYVVSRFEEPPFIKV